MLTSAQLSQNELDWQMRQSPVLAAVTDRLNDRSLAGARICLWKIISINTVPLVEALLASGAELIYGSSHPQGMSDAAADHMRQRGIEVLGYNGISRAEYAANVARAVAWKPDYVLSSGGAVLVACAETGYAPRAALEGTRTGTNRLENTRLAFPVFNWNDTILKNTIEHRFHVAEAFWAAFAYLTGFSLFGRTVLVVGFGPVGKGIAERARKLGAHVLVADRSPLRAAEAIFHGHQALNLDDAVAQAEIVVTVTGRDRVIGPKQYALARAGTMFLNAGHSAIELSIDWVEQQNLSEIRRRIGRFEVNGKELLLLSHGDAVNLASGAGPFGNDIWDVFNGLILRGAHWIHSEMPAATQPGLHDYPLALQEELAQALVDSRSRAAGAPTTAVA